MDIILVVTRAFGPYAVGAHITDPNEILAIRASSNHAKVVAVQCPPGVGLS